MQRIIRFWKSGISGKFIVGCGGLLGLIFLYAFFGLLFGRDSLEVAGIPTPTATPQPPELTNTPRPTVTETPILATSTPRPGRGHLVGRVLYECNKQPAQGYFVYIFPDVEGNANAIGKVKVDRNGRYVRHNLPAGNYRLTASDDPDARGFTYSQTGATVADGETTIADDTLVRFCPDLKLVAPSDGAVVTTNRPTFSWEPFPGDVEYEVLVYAEEGTLYHFPSSTDLTTETDLTAPEDLPSGDYEWSILVYKRGEPFSFGESVRWSFTIRSP